MEQYVTFESVSLTIKIQKNSVSKCHAHTYKSKHRVYRPPLLSLVMRNMHIAITTSKFIIIIIILNMLQFINGEN